MWSVSQIISNGSNADNESSGEQADDSVESIDPFDMICGDDVVRLPETVKPSEKKPEKIEEEEEEKPMTYAAVARSRPTSECNDNELVEDPVVEDIREEARED